MATETGHSINTNNFRTLATFTGSLGATYNPGNTALTTANLNTKWTAANSTLAPVSTAKNQLNLKQNERQTIYDPTEDLITRVINYLRASGASRQEIADAYTLVKKYNGIRTSPVTLDDPNTPENEASISASQQSYIKRAETLQTLINLLSSIPAYTPNEAAITIAGLTTLHTSMTTVNGQFGALIGTYATARQSRNVALYHPTTGCVSIAKQVKQYIRATFGPSSQQFKTANAIPFKTLAKINP